MRLDGLDGTHMTWALGDPVARQGWGASQTAMITRLLPHIRQFVCVRQALVRARAFETSVTALLENQRIGVVHLDRRGRVLAANDRALHILRDGDVLSDRDGELRACAPDEQPGLDRLLAAALPTAGTVAVSGSMPLRRSAGLPPGESQVAAWLAEGRSVAEMARDTGHTRRAIYWHLQQIYQKHHISRQADLVRLVLSVAGYS